MTYFRELPNKFLVAPVRGKPPEPPEGYETLVGEQFVFAPIMPICSYREKRTIQRGCCGATEKIHCDKEKQYVTRYHCSQCQAPTQQA